MAFTEHHLRRSRTARRQRGWAIAAMLAVGAVGIGVLYLELGPGAEFLVSAAPVVLFIGSFAAIYPWFYLRQVRRSTAGLLAEGKNRGLLRPITIDLSDLGLQIETTVSRLFYKWEAVKKISETANHIFIT